MESLKEFENSLKMKLLEIPLGDTHLAPISVINVGDAVAFLVLEKPFLFMNRPCILTGVEIINGHKMAKIISHVLGLCHPGDVKYSSASSKRVIELLMNQGMDEAKARGFIMILNHFSKESQSRVIAKHYSHLLIKRPTSFDEFAINFMKREAI